MMGETAKKPRNWGKIALLVSLALNLVVAGALVGASFGSGYGNHSRGNRAANPPGLRAYVHALPNDQRQEYLQNTRDFGKHLRRLMHNSSAKNEPVFEALREEQFSKDAFHTALDKQGQEFFSVLEDYHAQLILIVDTMTVEERRQYAQRVSKFKDQRWKKRSKN